MGCTTATCYDPPATSSERDVKVFLSWSKSESHRVALAFHAWLPDVLQVVEPWMSAENIESGQQWLPEVMSNLRECKFGILFVTKENMNSPWLLFEAGAIIHHLDSRVVPLLIDCTPSELQGPLSTLQAITATQSNIRKLVLDLNQATGVPLVDPARLDRIFRRSWGELEPHLQTDTSSLRPGTLDLAVEMEEAWEAISTHQNNIGEIMVELSTILTGYTARIEKAGSSREKRKLLTEFGRELTTRNARLHVSSAKFGDRINRLRVITTDLFTNHIQYEEGAIESLSHAREAMEELRPSVREFVEVTHKLVTQLRAQPRLTSEFDAAIKDLADVVESTGGHGEGMLQVAEEATFLLNNLERDWRKHQERVEGDS